MSKEELIQLILQLQDEIAALRLKLEKGSKPPTNSGNSSQPPSQDWKGNMPAKRRRRHGPPLGHEKHERKWVANPDRVVELKPRECQVCGTALAEQAITLVDVNQITELPIGQAEVIEVRQYAVQCSCCGQEQVEQPPAGLEMNRCFGARLESVVVYYRQEQHISYVRTQAILHNLHGVEISQGGIDRIMQRVGRQAQAALAPLVEKLRSAATIYSDETGSRVDGQNWWHWVFCGPEAILHVIRFDRSGDVIREIMQEWVAQAWVSDCWSAQLKAPASSRQLCLAHQLRNLQAVRERYPACAWAGRVQSLMRYAIHLHHQRSQLEPLRFQQQVQRLECLLDRLLERALEPAEAQKLQKRYRKYRDAVFLFLHRSDVEPTNNISEQYLRPAVIHRKVMGGFRSGWGADTYAALKSLLDTAALSQGNPLACLQSLLGTPALPLPV
jgi:transposase